MRVIRLAPRAGTNSSAMPKRLVKASSIPLRSSALGGIETTTLPSCFARSSSCCQSFGDTGFVPCADVDSGNANTLTNHATRRKIDLSIDTLNLWGLIGGDRFSSRYRLRHRVVFRVPQAQRVSVPGIFER